MKRLSQLQELELDAAKKRQEIAIADEAKRKSIENLRELQDVENDGEDRAQNREIKGKEADAAIDAQKRDDEIRKLELQGRMNPDVLLAIQAGHSPEVAAVLVEQAKAKSSSDTDKDALMRQMMDMMQANNVQSAEQARHALETAMTGAVGVAQGAGGGAVQPAGMGSAAAKVNCPDCGRPIPAEANICKYCGWKALV